MSDEPVILDLASHLRDRGVAEDEIAAAQAAGPAELRRLALAVLSLGETPWLRAPEVWARAGADEELGRRLWRAMGFPVHDDELVAFTTADVEALRAINDYLVVTGASPEIAVRFTRLLGQSMSRVADALLSIVDTGASEVLPDVVSEDLLVLAGEQLYPMIERELGYLLRRHLYAGTVRRLSAEDAGSGVPVAIGFADVVSFTRLSGELAETELAEFVERFEQTTADEIADRGGRVVKLIGDAVLFSFEDPLAATACALALVDRFGGDHPELRVGLAYGEVIARLGDLFGPTVNRASRLVSFARPGTVLVDDAAAGAIAGAPEVVVQPLRPRDLKGLGTTRMFVVRRPD